MAIQKLIGSHHFIILKIFDVTKRLGKAPPAFGWPGNLFLKI